MLIILSGYYALPLHPGLAQAESHSQKSSLVTQEFRYHLPEASEVYLVWGINGWQVLPEEQRPAGTVVDKVMHTPMKLEGDTFVIKIQVPANTPLDYGFQTRKTHTGPINPWVWDGDYRLTPTKDEVIEVKATVTLPQNQASQSSADVAPVTQQFRYHMPEAGEVYLVWGINGWNWVPEELRPAGTFVDGVMHTPMEPEGDTFVVTVQVPAGTALDYGFQTRKKRTGTPIEWVWDGNYRLIPAKDDIVDRQTAVTLTQAKEQPLDFDIGPGLLIGVCLVFSLRRIFSGDDRRASLSPGVAIIATSMSLYLFLLLIRANILGFDWISLRYSLPFVPDILAGGYYDLLYIGAIIIAFLALLGVFRHKPKIQRLLSLSYSGVALLSLLIAFLNIEVVQMLGRPFNYQWFYYSDFLKSADAQNAVLANVSWGLMLNAVTLSLAMMIAAYLLRDGLSLLPRYFSNRSLLIGLAMPLFAYFPVANWYINTNHWTYPKLANPITAFLGSVVDSQTHPFTMRLSEEDLAEFHRTEDSSIESVSLHQTDSGVRNVIIFVMESVAAEYVQPYGGTYPVTPELANYRQHSLLFNNIYAHAPASNKSLVSILSSIYPWLSYYSLTQKYPEVNLPTLSSELKKYGYRTAFLSAGDTGFQRGDEFLAQRQFDKIEDYKTVACERQKFDIEGWFFAGGVDEECLVDAFSTWQSEQPEQPFFTMMWTVGTHYPYFVVGEEVDYGTNNPDLNRYLNALHHSDRVLGQLLRTLDNKGLSESTLLVVVGDHGEAFGRHNQFVHASRIYEENVHVPFILINPSLFKGEENPTIGGHVDIAPTIMQILNLPAAAEWQGQSLLSHNRSGRTYLFSPWSDLLFGYREGNFKFIFNATTNSNEIYDLAVDPYETTNLADQRSDLTSLGQRRLAAWVQYQDKFVKQLFEQQK